MCFLSGKRNGYEPISGSQAPSSRRWLFPATFVTAFLVVFYSYQTRPHSTSYKSLETLPTLLSLRDPSSGDLINPKFNPLYQTIAEQPLVFAKEQEVLFSEVYTKDYWQVPKDLKDSNLWILYCGKTIHSIERASILEVATIQQLRFTYHDSRVPLPATLLARHEHCAMAIAHEKSLVIHQQVPLDFHHKNQPFGIHLTWQDAPHTLTVQFGSAGVGAPVVEVTGGSNKLLYKNATTTSYTNTDLCHAPANETAPGQFVAPGNLHRVVIPSSDRFSYRVGIESGQGVMWSDTFEVDLTHENSFIVYGDQGCPPEGWEVGQSWMQRLVHEESAAAIHHVGDLSYAQGAAHIWDAWLTMIEPAVARIPVQVGVGNHEYDYVGSSRLDPSGALDSYHPSWGNFGTDSGGECGVPTSKRFDAPSNGNGVFWYYYDIGLVRTIMLSSEHDLEMGSRQYQWFETTLAATNRTRTPWLVVELHRPLYEPEKYWNQYAVGVGLRYEVETLMVSYQVDLVLSGHYHAYHRSCDGLYLDKCDKGGPIHITVGTAGAHLDDGAVGTIDVEWSTKLIMKTFGYGRVTIANASALLFEFVQFGNSTDDFAGDVLDQVWIERER